MEPHRRNLLTVVGVALATPLAGCQTSERDTESPADTPDNDDGDVDDGGEGTTETPPPEDIPDAYRADRKRIAETGAQPQNIGNYSTEQNWDDLQTNTREINQMQQEWTEQETYTPLVDQVMEGEDLEAGGHIFPNYNFEGEENDIGFFDQDAVKSEGDFETLIRWYLPAIMHHDRQNYGSAPSSRYQRFGATLKTLINEHHPDAEAQATGVNSLPAHGIFGVQDKNNEEFYLVDTTPTSAQADSAVGRIGDFITSDDGHRNDKWDPYHSFEPGPQEGLHYEGKSETSMDGLFNFVENTVSNEQLDYDNFFITDQWMDDAYQLLRNGGSIEPITEPIEEIIYESIKQDKQGKVGIYGTLDDTRIAVTSVNEIYEKVMYEPETQTTEDIEAMLETPAA